jgi:hypothetical protein
MSAIIRFLEWISASVAKAERERSETYLATSANVLELERRQRTLNRHEAMALQRW